MLIINGNVLVGLTTSRLYSKCIKRENQALVIHKTLAGAQLDERGIYLTNARDEEYRIRNEKVA